MTSVFSFPTTIVYGVGAIHELAERMNTIRAARPMVVTDAGLVATPTFKRAMAKVPAGCQVFCDIRSNPTDAQVDAATAAFVQHGCESVIGLGGGSAIDVAKIIRLRALLPQWNLGQPLPNQVPDLAPFVAVPTTAGTGSEVGRSSVITVAGK